RRLAAARLRTGQAGGRRAALPGGRRFGRFERLRQAGGRGAAVGRPVLPAGGAVADRPAAPRPVQPGAGSGTGLAAGGGGGRLLDGGAAAGRRSQGYGSLTLYDCRPSPSPIVYVSSYASPEAISLIAGSSRSPSSTPTTTRPGARASTAARLVSAMRS